MKHILLILSLFLILNCSKNKSVLICGDHVCINKKEAQIYFEKNLSLEVKIIDRSDKKQVDLVKLNLKEDKINKKVLLEKKVTTDKEIKVLSNQEIKDIKEKIKKENIEFIKKKTLDDKKKKQKLKNFENKKKIELVKKRDNIPKVVDICEILEKCNIDEISKYLIKQAKDKKFPDITIRK